MITAHEASELLKTTTLKASELHRSMTPFQRLEILKNKVGEKTRIALETKIHETIAKCEMRVEIILGAKICVDKNEDIRAFLVAL